MKTLKASLLLSFLVVTALFKFLSVPMIVLGLIIHIAGKTVFGYNGTNLVLFGIGMLVYVQAVLCFEIRIDKIIDNTND